MISSTSQQEIQATLSRLDALVDTSHFGDDSERLALRQQLSELHREIGQLNEDAVPTSLHEALQHTEELAISRLGDSIDEDGESDITDLAWKDLLPSIEAWEAQHPRLAVALINFSDVLSKLGI